MTDEEILTEAARHLGEMHIENCGIGDIKDFARAIEAAATAPLLERIAELEAKDNVGLVVTQMKRIAKLEKSLGLVQQHAATAWNRGHQIGMMQNNQIAKEAQEAVKSDSWGNAQLTDALMIAEAKVAELEARIAQQAEAQEPVATINISNDDFDLGLTDDYAFGIKRLPNGSHPLFTRPQPAQLERLSEEEVREAVRNEGMSYTAPDLRVAKAIQSALAAKNGAELK